MSKLKDLSNLIGQKFNRLTILEDVGMVVVNYQKGNERQLKVKCDCGTIKYFRYDKVVKGQFKSCGCRGFSDFMKGCKKHPLYDTYHGFKQRCNNPKDGCYDNYGGRGIKVCEEWNNSVETFFKWALDNGWRKGLQLDRICNDGNYEPDNCRFVTSLVNNRNRRSNRTVTFNNKTLCITEWAEITGLHKGVIRNRLNKDWPLDKVFNKPLRQITSRKNKI